MHREKTAAVVVTYNRKNLLDECLESLLRQSHPLDAIYIIDNGSTDGTLESLVGKGLVCPPAGCPGEPAETVRAVPAVARGGSLVEIHYVRLPENTGGAGGFHEGLQRVTAAGFDWLWLMDDDVLTASDALEILVRKKDALEAQGHTSFLLNSLVLVRDQPAGDKLAFPLQELSAARHPTSGIFLPQRGVYHWRLSEVRDQLKDGLYRWICPFNGTFLPARAVREIGLPNKEFFLWGDERDFMWRAARRFDLYTVVDSQVFHPPCREPQFDWRHYYGIRNAMVVNRHFNRPALRNLRLILLSLARGIRHGPRGLTLVLRAIRDGLMGRLGKRQEYHP
jgi:GT2 family glycosyltransferase